MSTLDYTQPLDFDPEATQPLHKPRFVDPKSKRGAVRQYNAILRNYKAAFSGGGMFGYDWRTFALNDPDAYAHVQRLKTIYPGLPA